MSECYKPGLLFSLIELVVNIYQHTTDLGLTQLSSLKL